ncbi:glyoxalase [Pseudonocardia sp.]|uniref:VOC family protein n=1 Tax=Pseudonocardia sp. TaxID=60912 RepID=UPI0026078748|nr:glyoxalase [Pseudonocardia sp.]
MIAPRFTWPSRVDDTDRGLAEGRSAEHRVDRDRPQLVTHVAPGSGPVGHSDVDGHRVPVPHFGLVLVADFHATAQRLRDAGTEFVVESYRRFAGEPGEQWTMFLLDPAGNAPEFTAFRDPAQLFATRRAAPPASSARSCGRRR